MKIKFHYVLLFLIICLAIFFAFFNLNSVPPSPSLDEVTIGYNAYSILHTGKDEYGYRLPLLLRAYDDWRPALYVYLVIPFVKVFGLNVAAVRLPAVVLSILTIIFSYFLVCDLFKDKKYKNIIALLVSFLLVISPWRIYISRLGHEANLGFFSSIVAIYFFIHAIKNKKDQWQIILSAIFCSISLNTYQSEKIFIPVVLLFLVLIFWKNLLEIKKYLFIAIIIGGIISVSLIRVFLAPEGLERFRSTSAVSNISPDYYISVQNFAKSKFATNKVLFNIVTNRHSIQSYIILSNYLSHFNLYWLFSNSGGEAFKIPGLGLLYLWEAPFIFLGIFFLFREEKSVYLLVIAWIFSSFLAPAITTEAPHAMRAVNVLPMPELLAALGIINIYFFIKSKKIKVGYVFVLAFFILNSIIYCYKQYFYVFPQEQSKPFQYAISEAMSYVLKNQDKYHKIVFSESNNLAQSYMFYLFYSKYDPSKYLKEGGTKSGGFAVFHKIGKFNFRQINWAEDKKEKNTLIIVNPNEVSVGVFVIRRNLYLNGEDGVDIITL